MPKVLAHGGLLGATGKNEVKPVGIRRYAGWLILLAVAGTASIARAIWIRPPLVTDTTAFLLRAGGILLQAAAVFGALWTSYQITKEREAADGS